MDWLFDPDLWIAFVTLTALNLRMRRGRPVRINPHAEPYPEAAPSGDQRGSSGTAVTGPVPVLQSRIGARMTWRIGGHRPALTPTRALTTANPHSARPEGAERLAGILHAPWADDRRRQWRASAPIATARRPEC